MCLNAQVSETTTHTTTKMQIHINTQVRENYGAHDWDGNGECPQYWKNKGGDEYVITEVPETISGAAIAMIVSLAKQAWQIERNDESFQEFVIDYHLQPDGSKTWDELNQLEYDGKIDFPSKRKTVNEIFAA